MSESNLVLASCNQCLIFSKNLIIKCSVKLGGERQLLDASFQKNGIFLKRFGLGNMRYLFNFLQIVFFRLGLTLV